MRTPCVDRQENSHFYCVMTKELLVISAERSGTMSHNICSRLRNLEEEAIH